MTQDKPTSAGNTQNSSALNALTPDPLLGFCTKQKLCTGSDALGRLIYMEAETRKQAGKQADR